MTAPTADEITREIYIAAPPQTVYAYFTDPVKALRWKGQDATLDPRPSGVYRLILGEGNIVRGEYVRLTPYSQIVFTWGWKATTPCASWRQHSGDQSRRRARRDALALAPLWAAICGRAGAR